MRILFDHGTPRGLAPSLKGHKVEEAKTLGWHTLSNGDLLAAAEQAGFDVLLTTDKNLPYQQSLAGRKLAVIILGTSRWRVIEPKVPQVVVAVSSAKPGSYTLVDIPGGRADAVQAGAKLPESENSPGSRCRKLVSRRPW